MNIPDGRLTLAPNVPKKINRYGKLKNWPIFMPQFWAGIDYMPKKNSSITTFRIRKWHSGPPLIFEAITTKVPRGCHAQKATLALYLNGSKISSQALEVEKGTRRVTIKASFAFAKEGDTLTLTMSF